MDTTPIPASYASSSSFTVTSGYIVQFASGVRVLADCGTDGEQMGVVAAIDGTTVTLSMDDGAALTANLATVLHGNDLPASLANHGHTGQADGGNLFATASETQAGASTSLAVTPAGLAATAKGLIAANTTIYVRTDGNDSNDGTANDSSHAKLTIAGALSSIKNKLIASGVAVTIQVADGTYTITSTIIVDHPDADKIQILGNTSAETTVAIVSIDTTAKTITVAGDYTASLLAGDIFGLTGSSTSGLNGGYAASAVAFDGTNTVVTCSAEAIASATVGGGSVVIKPCNRCIISGSSGLTCFNVTRNTSIISGFRINVSGSGSKAVLLDNAKCTIGTKLICHGSETGVQASNRAYGFVQGILFKGCSLPLAAYYSTLASNTQKMIFHDVATRCVTAMFNSFVYLAASSIIMNSFTADYSPAANATGYNGNSYIQVS